MQISKLTFRLFFLAAQFSVGANKLTSSSSEKMAAGLGGSIAFSMAMPALSS
jgi:hypothetical protein